MPPQVKDLRQFVADVHTLNARLPLGTNAHHVLDNAEGAWSMQSLSDGQILVKIGFSGSVKLRALRLRSDSCHLLKAFTNAPTLDFTTIPAKAAQEWRLLSTDSIGEIMEYPVKPFKFANVSHLALLFESHLTARISYVGFTGELLGTRTPVQADYELRPQLADHKTGGLFDSVHSVNQ